MQASVSARLLLALCLAACDSGESKDETKAAAKDEPQQGESVEDPAAEKKAPEAKKKKKSKAGDSCEWFTPEQIKAGLGLPEGSTVEIEPTKFVVRTCSYTWKIPGESKQMSGKLDVAVGPSHYPDAAAADKGFTESMAKLSKMMTAGGKAPEFVNIEGVGARASWYAELRQLSVLEGKRFAHLSLHQLSDRAQNEPDKALELLEALAATKYGG